jgi:hypothetical protein
MPWPDPENPYCSNFIESTNSAVAPLQGKNQTGQACIHEVKLLAHMQPNDRDADH